MASRASNRSWQKHRNGSISRSVCSARHGKSGGLTVRLALVLLLGRSRVLRVFSSAALGLVGGACIWVFRSVRVEAIGSHADSLAIQTPVKAHLRDGSTVLYQAGVLLARDTLRGPGVRYGLTLRDSNALSVVPLDSVVAMESFRRVTNGAPTAIVSTLATGAALLGAAVAAFVIACSSSDCFGNCPTVYADSAATWALQAEGFSYTLGPTFETRDVDRLGVRPDRDGRIRLEVRNEALETEYVNHLELLEVRHAADETALPDPNGAALAVRELVPATTIADAAGRDLRLLLALPDGAAFQTDARTLAGASLVQLDDAIYLAAPAPAGADSVALVLRLRNSLLATLLYSDVMLGGRGARSLDWIGRDLDGGGAALPRWQEQRMGMRLAIWDGRRYHETARIRGTTWPSSSPCCSGTAFACACPSRRTTGGLTGWCSPCERATRSFKPTPSIGCSMPRGATTRPRSRACDSRTSDTSGPRPASALPPSPRWGKQRRSRRGPF